MWVCCGGVVGVEEVDLGGFGVLFWCFNLDCCFPVVFAPYCDIGVVSCCCCVYFCFSRVSCACVIHELSVGGFVYDVFVGCGFLYGLGERRFGVLVYVVTGGVPFLDY